jgi:hypothetical protein
LLFKASVQSFILIEPFVCYVAIVSSFLWKLSGRCNDFQLSFNAIVHVIKTVGVLELTISSILINIKVNSFETLISLIKLSDQWEERVAEVSIKDVSLSLVAILKLGVSPVVKVFLVIAHILGLDVVVIIAFKS